MRARRPKTKFAGMLNAFRHGAPPHGGTAPGIDRIVMLLAGEENLREVTMFPMTQQAQDLLMNAPSPAQRQAAERAASAGGLSGEVNFAILGWQRRGLKARRLILRDGLGDLASADCLYSVLPLTFIDRVG